jgi:hypothetical protein
LLSTGHSRRDHEPRVEYEEQLGPPPPANCPEDAVRTNDVDRCSARSGLWPGSSYSYWMERRADQDPGAGAIIPGPRRQIHARIQVRDPRDQRTSLLPDDAVPLWHRCWPLGGRVAILCGLWSLQLQPCAWMHVLVKISRSPFPKKTAYTCDPQKGLLICWPEILQVVIALLALCRCWSILASVVLI